LSLLPISTDYYIPFLPCLICDVTIDQVYSTTGDIAWDSGHFILQLNGQLL